MERGGAPQRPLVDALEAVAELARRLLACEAAAIVAGAESAAAFGSAAVSPRDPRVLADPIAAEESGLGFYAAVPLRAGDRDLGTLAAVGRVPRELAPEELDTLKLAGRIAAALVEPAGD